MTRPQLDLCLDFSNTVDWRNGPGASDRLADFESLLAFVVKAKVLGRQEADRIRKAAAEDGQGAEALRQAKALRETIYGIFSSVAAGNDPAELDIKELNRFLSSLGATSKVIRMGHDFEWEWDIDCSPQDQILWPIAKSTADLLTSGHLERVRECANHSDGCGWVFMDRTKSQTRKWCDMGSCGNRAKVRAWYDRNNKQHSPAPLQRHSA